MQLTRMPLCLADAQRRGEPHDAGLGRRVGGLVLVAEAETGVRRDIHDGAATARIASMEWRVTSSVPSRFASRRRAQ